MNGHLADTFYAQRILLFMITNTEINNKCKNYEIAGILLRKKPLNSVYHLLVLKEPNHHD